MFIFIFDSLQPSYCAMSHELQADREPDSGITVPFCTTTNFLVPLKIFYYALKNKKCLILWFFVKKKYKFGGKHTALMAPHAERFVEPD